MKTDTNGARRTEIGKWLTASVIAFSLFQFFGGDLLHLSQNYRCFSYIGCNIGFFGYDALVHFFGGIMEAVFLVWLFENYPRFNLLSANFWKNALVIVAICAFIGVSWEIWEFGYDHVRMDIFREDLVKPNVLLQPTNADTMGDLTFGLAGGAAAVALMKVFEVSSILM